MKPSKTIIIAALACVACVVVACKQEAPPAPAAPATPAPPVQQQAAQQPEQPQEPEAPKIVYASAEPAHGGTTQKMGDWMVELATGAEGKVDFYVQRYEGAEPSFDKVKMEVIATPDEADQDAEGEEEEEEEEEEEDADRSVVFYPEDGKLQGTVAGITEEIYDFDVKIYEMATDEVSQGTFEDVEVEPLETDLEAKHGGIVHVIDETKMEVVQEGDKLLVYLRDMADEVLSPEDANVEEVVIEDEDGEEQSVEIEPVKDHFEGEIESEGDAEEEAEEGAEEEAEEESPIKIVNLMLSVGEKKYENMIVPKVGMLFRDEDGKRKIPTPPMTQAEAEKGKAGKEMKGTIGAMKVGAAPAGAVKKAGKKKSKGPVTKAKKAGAAKKAGKKKSKGPVTKAKKAR